MFRLLIVDDEKMIRMGMKLGIQWDKIEISEVFVAGSTEEALYIIEENYIDILITDINMAEKSGLELIRLVKIKNENMRIIVISGYDKFEYARECVPLGVQDFLLKPVDENELMNIVSSQILELKNIKNEEENRIKQVRTEGAIQQIKVEKYMKALIYNRLDITNIECPQELKKDLDTTMEIAILLPELQSINNIETNFKNRTIKDICIDLIDIKKIGISFNDDDGRIVIAFYTENTEISVVESIYELSSILKDECDIKPRIILGSMVYGLKNLFISYNDALHILDKERESFSEISMTNDKKNREYLIEHVNREFENAILNNLPDGDKVMDIFDKFSKAILSYNLSNQLAKKWCFSLFANTYFTYVGITGDLADDRIDKLIQSITGVDRATTIEITRKFMENIMKNSDSGQDEIIVKAKKYISENLEKKISVTSLAEMFYLSPNYFSRLFKKTINEGCNEYIVRKRIEKSKYLLETTNIKSGEIANMVGYNDTNYFSLAFKKYTGMSPTTYRNNAKKR